MTEDTDVGLVRWYGESWESPINECPQAATPVGVKCAECPETIRLGDRGVLIVYATSDIAEVNRLEDLSPPEIVYWEGAFRFPYHLRCWLRSVVGSDIAAQLIDHMTREGRYAEGS